ETAIVPYPGKQSLGLAIIMLTQFGIKGGLLGTLLHETGHALGLGHSLVYSVAELESDTFNSMTTVMFPFDTGRSDHLHANDKAWLSYLYPNQSEQPTSTVGTIRLTLINTDGDPGA